MPVERTTIDGLFVVRWDRRSDARGFFRHSYQWSELEAALGRSPRFRQGNHSRSLTGVLRGFHTEPWDKFLYVARGLAQCVVADVRPDSPTFSKTEIYLMGDEPGEHIRLFVSRGLSNAFYCIKECDYLNDVSEEFDPSGRGGVSWNDPDLAVRWPSDRPILSDADRKQPLLRSLFPGHPLFKPDRASGD